MSFLCSRIGFIIETDEYRPANEETQEYDMGCFQSVCGFIYLDDCKIFSLILEQHVEHVEELFQCIEKQRLQEDCPIRLPSKTMSFKHGAFLGISCILKVWAPVDH